MSAINTSGINVNYPVPGVNNNSQGFRDNFSAIKNSINTATTEITDLQNKVVVKAALTGTTVNNDMGNTLISNASTRGFRATTYNLGNALSGVVIVNASLGDVQYGTIVGNTTIQFAGWAPAGTQSNVQLSLSVGNADAVISLPSEVTMNGSYGIETIENFANIGNVATISVPYDVSQLQYRFSTLDCGNNITIEPYNRPRQTSQINQRTPSPVGQPGDVLGAVCTDMSSQLAFATVTASDALLDYFTCDSTAGFYLDMPFTFYGDVFGSITEGTVYYIRSIVSETQFTVSEEPGTPAGPGTLVSLVSAIGTMYLSPITYLYVSSGTFDGSVSTKFALNTSQTKITGIVASNTESFTDTITVTSTAGLVLDYPITFSGTPTTAFALQTYATGNVVRVSTTSSMVVGGKINFTGNTFGGINSGTSYYIKNIYSGNSNITVSTTFGGSNVALSNGTGNANATYGGVFGNLQANTTYYVKSINSNTITVSDQMGGSVVPLIDENGSMTATATTDYVVTLNSSSGLAVNDPITFTGTVFGGLEANTVYYISNISSSNISLSQTRYNGTAGQKMVLSTGSGNLLAEVQHGTPIWKRTQLVGW